MGLVSTFAGILFGLTLAAAAPEQRVNEIVLSSWELAMLKSPNFPSDYPTNFKDTWVYTCPDEHRHQIVLGCSTFELESSFLCLADRLKLISFGKIDVKCGLNNPSFLVTATGWLTVAFTSNGQNVEQGFDCEVQCIPTPLSCGIHMLSDGETVYIQSPNFPDDYHPLSWGYWEFFCKDESDHELQILCGPFELEDSTDCTNDRFVVTHDGSVDVFCDDDDVDVVTATGWARINFATNLFTSALGFICTISCNNNGGEIN